MRSAVARDLARLVAFETVSPRPVTELVAFVAQRLEDLGFAIQRIPEPDEHGKTNLVATAGPPGTDGLTLSGHMDVVPVDGQPWSTDPFDVVEREGRLYGRGTTDMLGFLAAVLAALERVPIDRLQRQLVLIWTHDEELGCVGAGKLVDAVAATPPDWPRACLIGEPTDFTVMRMHPGHVKLQIDVEGEAAHSSRPALGRNAIETAAEVVLKLRGLSRQLQAEVSDLPLATPWVTMNTGLISGGSAINIVPDHCGISVGYRPLPGMDALTVYRRIEALVADVEGVSTSLGTVTPSLSTPSGSEIAALLTDWAQPGPEAAPFATDGGQLQRLGLRPVVFGPGCIDRAHKADEYVEVEALMRTVGIVEEVVRRRCL